MFGRCVIFQGHSCRKGILVAREACCVRGKCNHFVNTVTTKVDKGTKTETKTKINKNKNHELAAEDHQYPDIALQLRHTIYCCMPDESPELKQSGFVQKCTSCDF